MSTGVAMFLDPSGNFHEGKGTTGFAIFKNRELVEFGHMKAADSYTMEDYWSDVAYIITDKCSRHGVLRNVFCEDYRLQPSKAGAQSHSRLETPQLIGYLRMVCHSLNVPFKLLPTSNKARVSDEQLVHLGYLQKERRYYTCGGFKTIIHERDAIRHGIYHYRYTDKGV